MKYYLFQCSRFLVSSQVDKLLQSGESELHLKPSNGYQRKLTYQVIGQRSDIGFT